MVRSRPKDTPPGLLTALERVECGTLLSGRRAFVWMPRWFYASALTAMLGVGVVIGRFL